MSNPIYEQNEWVRDELAKLWGDNQADYFVNPARMIQKTDEIEKDELLRSQNHSTLATVKRAYHGLYAYPIWQSLRDESGDKLKPFELEKELQVTLISNSIN